MIIIDTEVTVDDIVSAINTVAKEINRRAEEKNEFARSIMLVDLDTAELELEEAHEQIEASRLLLNFAMEMVENELES
jgi:hypothetical protein